MEEKTIYHLNYPYILNPLQFDNVFLVQIVRRYCKPTEVIQAHPHLNWFELTIVTGGKGTVITNGKETEVNPNDIYLSFPCDVHEIKADKNSRLEYDFFSFYVTDQTINADLKNLTRNNWGEKSRVIQDEKISDLVKNAIVEMSNLNEPYAKNVLTNIFRLIIIYLLRNFKNIKQNTANVSNAEILCFQLMKYIDNHVYSLQNLSDIAPKFNYNYGYLSGLFKKTTGKTLSEYFHHRKMETAKALVIENKKKIGEIAQMLGYTLFAFSKTFKATYGQSPKEMQIKNTINN